VTAVPDPRTQAFARITAGVCLIVANSSVAWSVTAANEYATARGVPLGNIVSVPLGTSRDWDPGSNDAIADFANTIRSNWLAKGARAVLIAPGCPTRVVVRGVISGSSTYTPTATGLPPFGHLVQGAPSYASLLTGGAVMACREVGSGRWVWWLWTSNVFTRVEAWNTRVAWKLGLSDNRNLIDGNYELVSLKSNEGSPTSLGSGSFPTTLASTYAGWSGSRVIPAGRIGWSAWRRPSSAFDETVDNWDGPLLSSLAADSLTAQPEPLLFSLNNNTASGGMWAGLAKSCADWGYDTEYFYRGTPTAAMESMCPVAGAVWSKADFEGGSIVGAPYYLFSGDSLNADDPVRTEPFKSALSPVDGSVITAKGPSYAYEWGIRGLQTGAAAASIDVTHRSSGETQTAWVSAWEMLKGMSGLEALWNNISAPFPSGDPLHRPFHFDPAPSVPLFGGVDPPLPPVIPPYDNNPPTLQYNKRSDRFRDYRGRGRRW
jgi:hypothetical protein